MSFNKDKILVNDDDHEDLVRICNIFNLFKLSDKEIVSVQKPDDYYLNRANNMEFSKLFDEFDNKQITSRIPFLFKQSYSQTDYRVFRFDEIQRKLIYGLLRRSYALLAEVLMQNALRCGKSENFSRMGIDMIKKYVG